MKTRILLVDDHQLMREGLRSLLTREPDLEVVGEAADGRTAVELATRLTPNLVVMDISMPNLNGIDATRLLRGLPNAPQVVVVSMRADKRFASQALQAGAAGYVTKDSAFAELVIAIRAIRDHGVYLTPRIATLLAADYRAGTPGDATSPLSVLSIREREVLQLLVEGHAAKGIATTLHISIKTVEAHRRRLMERLNIDNLPDLVKCALREGLTQLEE